VNLSNVQTVAICYFFPFSSLLWCVSPGLAQTSFRQTSGSIIVSATNIKYNAQPALNQVKRKFYSPINNDHSSLCEAKSLLLCRHGAKKKENHAAFYIPATFSMHAPVDFEVAPFVRPVLISEMENA
jgi:hypothetical protein